MHPLNNEEIKQFAGGFNLDAAVEDFHATKASENVLLAKQLETAFKTVLNDLRWQQDLLNQVRQHGRGSVRVKVPHIEARADRLGEIRKVQNKFEEDLKKRLSDNITVWFHAPRGFFDRIRGLGTVEVEYREPVNNYLSRGGGISSSIKSTMTPYQNTIGTPGQMDCDSL